MSRGVTFALCALTLVVVPLDGENFASASETFLVTPDSASTPGASMRGSLAADGQIAVRPDQGGPDESALRYYASKNETARVDIEMRRLRRLYPNWQPPKDLYSTAVAAGGDESALWALFAADKLNELRAAIAERGRKEPGWRPSADLEQKMRGKATRLNIMTLWKEGRWKDVIHFVKSGAYDTASVDTGTLWIVAEAYAKTKQTSDAVAVYKSILTSDNNQQERLATFQKAMATLRMSDVESLLAMARTQADGKPEYEPIMIDVIRARISSYLHAERSEEIPADQLRLFEDYARSSTQPNQAGLVAWYYFKLKAFENALEWFKVALAHGGDAMIAHGLANSLQGMGYDRQAEEVAYAWRKPLVNNDIFFIDVVEKELTQPAPDFIDPARLARYAQVAMDTESGEGAQALAWYAYNTCQFDIALEWFQRAVAWYPKETSVRGYALALQRLRKKGPYFALMNRYDGLFPQVLDLIFPDGSRHAPTLCERRPPGIRHGVSVRVSDFTVPGPAEKTDEARQAHLAPEPKLALTSSRSDRMPKIDRNLFPVSTEPANRLRASMTSPSPTDLGLSYLPEPSRGPWPLVARRVPGVGPMPYERYGFMLLPGWNGVKEATWPPASEQPAPPGSLWARETQSPAPTPSAEGRREDLPVSQWTPPSSSPEFKAPAAEVPTAAEAPAAPAPRAEAVQPVAAPAPQTPLLVEPEAPVPTAVPDRSGGQSRRSWDPEPVGAIEAAPEAPPPILAGSAAPPLLLRESEASPQIVVRPESSPEIVTKLEAPPPILASPNAPPILMAVSDEPPSIVLSPPVSAAASTPPPSAQPIDATAVAPSWSVGAALADARQFRQGAIK